MNNIVFTQSIQDITPEEGWINKTNFKNKDGIVTGPDGKKYILNCKMRKKCSTLERIFRVAMGCFATVLTLGMGYLYSKSIRRLFKETKESKIFAVLVHDQSFVLNFYDQTEQMSFWEAYLSTYKASIGEWKGIKGLLFLREELQGVKSSLQALRAEVNQTSLRTLEKLGNEERKESFTSFSSLLDSIDNLIQETESALSEVSGKIERESGAENTVLGLENDGNTCYINSALQPLLAIANFDKLVPKQVSREPSDTFQERQSILNALKEFISAWKSKKPSSELGLRVGELRRQIFQAALWEGGFLDRNQEKSFQDAGQFFELILHVIEMGFKLELTTTPVINKNELLLCRKRVETTPEGVFYLKKSGATIQEKIDKNSETVIETFDSGCEWRLDESLSAKKFSESQVITGSAPEILVLRVDHVVNPDLDDDINIAPLLKNKSSNCPYKLVGFSQNHSQVHWTSVVKNGHLWKHCDDSVITDVTPNDDSFKKPANYMVYRKL